MNQANHQAAATAAADTARTPLSAGSALPQASSSNRIASALAIGIVGIALLSAAVLGTTPQADPLSVVVPVAGGSAGSGTLDAASSASVFTTLMLLSAIASQAERPPAAAKRPLVTAPVVVEQAGANRL